MQHNNSKFISLVVTRCLITVGIVMANKHLWVVHKFYFVTTLSLLHFIATSVGTHIMLRFEAFEYKAASIKALMPLIAGAVFAVLFMNLYVVLFSTSLFGSLLCIPTCCSTRLQESGVQFGRLLPVHQTALYSLHPLHPISIFQRKGQQRRITVVGGGDCWSWHRNCDRVCTSSLWFV